MPESEKPQVYAVFEGGGIKGFALVGALARVQEEALTITGFAGTSAGAVLAALAAVGYRALDPKQEALNPDEVSLNKIMAEMNLLDFLDGQQQVPLAVLRQELQAIVPELQALVAAVRQFMGLSGWHWIAKAKSMLLIRSLAQRVSGSLQAVPKAYDELVSRQGIYGTQSFTAWIRKHLEARGPIDPDRGVTFGALALRNIMLKIVATDLATGRARVYDPDRWAEMQVADAVRPSISIPIFFQPSVDQALLARDGSWGDLPGRFLVDGGMISNFPAAVFSLERQSGVRVIGFRLTRPNTQPEPETIADIEQHLAALFRVARDAEDPVKTEGARKLIDVMIEIPVPFSYTATQFDLSDANRRELFNLGYRAAHQVLNVPANRRILALT